MVSDSGDTEVEWTYIANPMNSKLNKHQRARIGTALVERSRGFSGEKQRTLVGWSDNKEAFLYTGEYTVTVDSAERLKNDIGKTFPIKLANWKVDDETSTAAPRLVTPNITATRERKRPAEVLVTAEVLGESTPEVLDESTPEVLGSISQWSVSTAAPPAPTPPRPA